VTLAEAYQGVTRTFELTESGGHTRRLEVKIPAGVNDGARLRIAGQGIQGGAGRGDLYLRIHVRPDPRFSRDDTTLRTTVEVPLAVAMLGGEVRVPTPDGRQLLLRIPAETDSGQALRLRGQGMPQINQPDKRGDLYAEVKVVLPKQLTAEQRRLFEEFARSIGYNG
jgi:curved DNA-binding protein